MDDSTACRLRKESAARLIAEEGEGARPVPPMLRVCDGCTAPIPGTKEENTMANKGDCPTCKKKDTQLRRGICQVCFKKAEKDGTVPPVNPEWAKRMAGSGKNPIKPKKAKKSPAPPAAPKPPKVTVGDDTVSVGYACSLCNRELPSIDFICECRIAASGSITPAQPSTPPAVVPNDFTKPPPPPASRDVEGDFLDEVPGLKDALEKQAREQVRTRGHQILWILKCALLPDYAAEARKRQVDPA